ncbi:MAG: hypothetical protein HKN93_05065, partial [Acidimicrobiia bacterium]|nr:hypothetical protein [Acidimicrobiia bacterium]
GPETAVWNSPPLAQGLRGIPFGDSILVVGGHAVPTDEVVNGYTQWIDVGSVWLVDIEE